MQGTYPSEPITMFCSECGGLVVEEFPPYGATAPRKFCIKCQKYVDSVNYINGRLIKQEINKDAY